MQVAFRICFVLVVDFVPLLWVVAVRTVLWTAATSLQEETAHGHIRVHVRLAVGDVDDGV